MIYDHTPMGCNMLAGANYDGAVSTKVDTEALHLRVYRQLAGMVMGGLFKPGQELTLRSVADMVGTSPMPVRDAVRRLITARALEMRPGRRIGVPNLSSEQVREIYRLRILLEAEAASVAAQVIKDRELDALEALHRQIETANDEDETGRLLWNLNRQFHFQLVTAAGMPQLSAFVEMLWLQTGPLVNEIPLRVSQADMVQHHQPIVDALRQRNSKRAAGALVADLSSAVARMLGKR